MRRGKPGGMLRYLREREGRMKRKWITQDKRRHQPPEPVPLLYTTLYLLSILKSVHVVYSNQLIATEALDKGLQNNKEKGFLQVGFRPLPPDPDRGGEGRERGRRQGSITTT